MLGQPPTAYLLSLCSDPTHSMPTSHTNIQGRPMTHPERSPTCPILHGPIRVTWPLTDTSRGPAMRLGLPTMRLAPLQHVLVGPHPMSRSDTA